jgi:hypothetical protein
MTRRTRVQRLAAISLTGGVALTLIGSTSAWAGDADATGNSSASDSSQSLNATPGSDATIGDIGGTTTNVGGGVANSGTSGGEGAVVKTGNAKAGGNQSTSKMDQSVTSSGKGGGTSVIGAHAFLLNAGGAYADTGFNTGDSVESGNATAWGNKSTSSVGQWVVVEDEDGQLRLVDQQTAVTNLGAAIAETGWNVATGDDSTNDPA